MEYRWQHMKTSQRFFTYIFDTILYKVSMACTKMAKIEVANTQLPVCFETVFLCFLNILLMRGFDTVHRYTKKKMKIV